MYNTIMKARRANAQPGKLAGPDARTFAGKYMKSDE